MQHLQFSRLIPLSWREEFRSYGATALRRDLFAGLSVGAVALPLALAFGVASGADAAAGLVTAILAGLIIGGLGGAAFQINGPTGVMSAVLIVVAARYGLAGVWTATLIAGILLLLLGILRLGRYVAFIPSPVIAGFTSGIALIIAIGQVPNVLGISLPAEANSLATLAAVVRHGGMPDPQTLLLAGLVIVTMLISARFFPALPGSLIGITLATLVSVMLHLPVAVIGDIPHSIVLAERLTLSGIDWDSLSELITPAFSIAALAAIESLLSGSIGATMSGKPFDANLQLIAQGIGNMVIPFFGGVPATAALARTSVAIRSGAVTRLTGIFHALFLLLAALVLAPLLSVIPLAALGGVLLVTAWRMNEWETLRFFIAARMRHALFGFAITMLATAVLDLTQAILIGVSISALIYLRQSAVSTAVSDRPVDVGLLRIQGITIERPCPQIRVFYLTGPIFFGSVPTILAAFRQAEHYRELVISMRGVPLIDAMGAQALRRIVEEQHSRGGRVSFSALQPGVQDTLERAGLLALIGADALYWSSALALEDLHRRHTAAHCPACSGDAPPDSV
jgi:sulfate permease, SulP family